MTKYNKTLAITTIGGYTVSVSDATVAGVASSVYDAMFRKEDLHFNNGTNEVFIPFHAIDHVIITSATATADDPVDANCTVIETGCASNEQPGDNEGGN